MRYTELRECRPAFETFCQRYESTFRDVRQRRHFRSYLRGLLGPLERKSIEPIALEQDVDVRMLQHFIGASKWDEADLLAEHRSHVAASLGDPTGVLILDPRTFPKRGEKSVGVARQWCGQLGKQENCQSNVNLVYASHRGHAFLDRRFYLPRSWASDWNRRRSCGVPDDIAFRTSWELAYEMLAIARSERIPHAWVIGDEEFGKVPRFHRWLDEASERYMIELPSSAPVWLSLPRGPFRGPKGLFERLAESRPGRPRKLSVGEVPELLPRSEWRDHVIRNASKGPIRVVAIAMRASFPTGGEPERREGWLVLSETTDQRRQRKFFKSNAEIGCPIERLLEAGYSRWAIEQDHEQGKNETGLGEYETRTWSGWHHHTGLSMLAHHFLVTQRNRLGEKIPRDDRGRDQADRLYRVPTAEGWARSSRGEDGVSTAAQSGSAHRPLEASPRTPRDARHARSRRRATDPGHRHPGLK